MGLAKSSRPGRTAMNVDNQIARIGVDVRVLLCAKYWRSGSPGSCVNEKSFIIRVRVSHHYLG